MKTSAQGEPGFKPAHAAFSITEVLVAISIVGVLFLSLYGGITSGFAVVNLARENLRANQIVLEKMETIRLYTWDQINSNGFIPTNFVAPFYAVGPQTNSSFAYYGTMTIEPTTKSESYKDDLRLVTIEVVWTNGTVPQHRQMQTFVARYGLQHYIY